MTLKNINDLNRHIVPITTEINQAVARVIASGWFVLGPEVSAFEKEFADYCGVASCVTVANGTDALELALRALGIGQGSKVLTVANAGMYSTTAILSTGATPVYVDINPDSLLMNVADVRDFLVSQQVDAIIVTHLYGLLADIEPLLQLAKNNNIPVIEDCAQAHGAMLHGKKAGSFGDIGCFSFYPTKNLGALGDGGAITTNNQQLAKRVRQLRQYGWESKYCATLANGCNSRLDEMQAAILKVMLPLLDQWNARRRDIASRYSQGIRHKNVVTPSVHTEEYVAHLYVIRTPERDSLKQHLIAAGIPCDIHYPIPDYKQVAYKHLFPQINLPITELNCNQVLTLPCFPEMTDSDVDRVIDCVNNWK